MRKSGVSVRMLLVSALVFGVSSSVLAADVHPHIRAAVKELEGARTELKEAAHDFGGHREDALKAVDNAIKQLNKADEFVKDKSSAPLPAAAPAEPNAKHPHIRGALVELKETRTALKEAAHDFGGHRAEALEAVDVAVKQLKLALESVKK